MILITFRKQHYRLFTAFVLGVVMLAGNSLFAQDCPNNDHGVASWQAKRAIEDYTNRFIIAQKEFARKKLPNNEFSVRVKIEQLTSVYNKDAGCIWIAQFSGAILPTVYDKDKEQGYAHGILKIYADKNKDVQVVVNEGEGLWKMSQKTSILYEDLPKEPGKWKELGGPGEPPEPPGEIANGEGTPTTPTPPTPPKRNVISDPEVVALGKRVAAAKGEEKQKLTLEYYELIRRKTEAP